MDGMKGTGQDSGRKTRDQCNKCSREPAIYLHYSDVHLCRGHFIEMFEKRFRTTVRQLQLVKKGERIVVALSGGKDSVVLMHLLAGLKKNLPFELIALTIDEGISGYRAPTISVAKHEAKKLGVRHVVLSFNQETGKTLDALLRENKSASPCSYCGVIRRHLLNRGARKLGAHKIAFGHNLDDICQTIFMNIMRNEPLRLVRFGEPLIEDGAFVPRIRPLMRAPEREIAAYAMLKGIKIDFRECPYAHSAFRQDVRRKINELEELYPGTKQRILHSFTEMHGWMKKGLEGKKFEISHCPRCGEPTSGKLAVGSLGECMYCKMINMQNEER